MFGTGLSYLCPKHRESYRVREKKGSVHVMMPLEWRIFVKRLRCLLMVSAKFVETVFAQLHQFQFVLAMTANG